jgi:hypothetical protein
MNVTPNALQDALKQVDFPAQKDELLRSAEGLGADEEILQALRSLPPEVQYENKDEVVRSVRHPAAGTEPTPQQASQRHRDDDESRVAERLR